MVVGSSPTLLTIYADVTELVNVLVLETKFWEFDSPRPHHFVGRCCNGSIQNSKSLRSGFDSLLSHQLERSMMTEIEQLLEEALLVAHVAAEAWSQDNPDQWYPCGWANVIIKPARGPLITYLKKNKIGCRAYEGGWYIHNPDMTTSQSMDLHTAGAAAFAEFIYGMVNAGVKLMMSLRQLQFDQMECGVC